jgi:hypothetical protein
MIIYLPVIENLKIYTNLLHASYNAPVVKDRRSRHMRDSLLENRGLKIRTEEQ